MELRATPEARDLLADFFAKYPEAYAHEVKCTKITDLVGRIEEFFALELQEPEHASLWDLLEQTGGIITDLIVAEWIQQNYQEIYVDNKQNCNPG